MRTSAIAAAASILLASVGLQAQNRGVYPLGMSATNSGVTPESGFTYSNQLLFYARDQSKDDDGNKLPVMGRNAVVMDMNSFVWVSNTRILGATYSATATIPFARNNLTSDINGQISGGGGLADSYYMPLILGWNRDRFAVRAIYGFLAPTGRYGTGVNNNVGSGYWTHALSSGQTFYLTQAKTVTFSAFQMYEFHTTQEGTGIHPGETFDLDYSLMSSVVRTPRFGLQIGLTGYEARQTTRRTGPEITLESSATRYAVNSLGFAVNGTFPKHKVNLGVKYFKEFENRSTYQGYSLQFTGGISF